MGQGGQIQGTTAGTLLGGHLTYHQLPEGHRTGFEPVLLAAAVPATHGEFVLEAGTGAGAALLCLASRVPGITGIGIELESRLAILAQNNFKLNNLTNLACIQANAENLPFPAHTFHHILANPPWFSTRSTASATPLRARAHHADPQTLARWITSLTAVLRPGGTLTLILPAAALTTATAALRTHHGAITLFPLWPRAGKSAKIILLGARKASKSPDRILPGLVLHDEKGITDEAQNVLRGKKALLFL